MSDVVIVALINLVAIVITRWHSHKEHIRAHRDISEIKILLNGKEHK